MAMRGRFSSATTSDGSDYEHRQKVASYYKQSATARSRLRFLFAADALLAVPVLMVAGQSLAVSPDDYLPAVVVALAVVTQGLNWLASFKTRSWRFVTVMALASILSSFFLAFTGYNHSQVVAKGSYSLMALAQLAVGVISLQLASAFRSAAARSSK